MRRGRDLESDIQRDWDRGIEGQRETDLGALRATETEKERDRKCNRETEKGGWGEGAGREKETEKGGQMG